jgi:hypothetical protein
VPRITIEAVHADNGPRQVTFSERIIVENLASEHYVRHLIERLDWATADAEDLEAGLVGLEESEPSGARRSPRVARPRGDRPRSTSARLASDGRVRA